MNPSESAKLSHLLRHASRTFAVGIEALPQGLREAVRLAYLLLRISDYLEDDPQLTTTEKVEALEIWDAVLGGELPVPAIVETIGVPLSSTPDAAVAREAETVVAGLDDVDPRYRQVLVEYVRRSTQGMRRWVLRGPSFESEEDLDDYMYQVAGLVGLLLTDLFAIRSRRMRERSAEMAPLAVQFGLGLQTVNVIRGLSKDIERGWIYVPERYARDVGLSREALFLPENRAAALLVLERLVAKARQHLEDAVAFVELIPRSELGVRVFCALPLLFAVRTLALSRGNPAVFSGEVKMPRSEVHRIVRETRVLGWSNRWVRSAASRLARASGGA